MTQNFNGYKKLGIQVNDANTGEKCVKRLVWKWYVNMEGWEEALARKLFHFCKKGGVERISFEVYDVETNEILYERQ